MAEVLEIRMQRGETQCSLCGAETTLSHGIPTFNGDIVSNDFPDWLWRTGGGSIPVCGLCYDRHERGEVPTFDRDYLHLDGLLSGGDGI